MRPKKKRNLIRAAVTNAAAANETRSSDSPLVRGLRGESPFDGSQFPPLPWGEKPLAKGEVRVVAEWIDDDSPKLDEKIREVFEPSPNEYEFQRGELKQRMSIDCMDETRIEKVRDAFRHT